MKVILAKEATFKPSVSLPAIITGGRGWVDGDKLNKAVTSVLSINSGHEGLLFCSLKFCC